MADLNYFIRSTPVAQTGIASLTRFLSRHRSRKLLCIGALRRLTLLRSFENQACACVRCHASCRCYLRFQCAECTGYSLCARCFRTHFQRMPYSFHNARHAFRAVARTAPDGSVEALLTTDAAVLEQLGLSFLCIE